MDENKISVELELDTSKYKKGIKEATGDFEEFQNRIKRQQEINLNINKLKNDLKDYQKIIDDTKQELDKISKNVGKQDTLKITRDNFEPFVDVTGKKVTGGDDTVKISSMRDVVSPLKGHEEEYNELVSIVNNYENKLIDIQNKIIDLTAEQNKLLEITKETDNATKKIKDGYIDGVNYLNGVKLVNKEIVEDKKKETNEQKKITSETRKTNKEIKQSHSGIRRSHKLMLSITSLIRRIGMSMRRQIVTQIASALNPLNMMKKTFSYLTDTISPRLGATFKNIGNNLTEYFANSPLFKTMINQLLYIIKLLQDAFNAIAKLFGFRQIDLFKTSKKSAKEIAKSASQTVASFDEINDIGNQGQNNDNVPLGLGELNLTDQSNKIFDMINTTIDKLNNFFNTFDFKEFGKKLGERFTEIFTKIDWPKVAKLAVEGLTGLVDIILGFIEGTDWGKVAKTVGESAKTALNTLSTWIKKVDWNKLATNIMTALNDIVVNLDYFSLFKTAFEIAGNVIGGLGVLIGNLVAGIGVMIYDYFSKFITIDEGDSWLEIGIDIITGIFNGIISIFTNINTWIYDNIFKPFIDGVKNAFGIHSPSTEMATIGEDIINGLKNGIGDVWSKVKSKFETFKTNISNKFNEIKTSVGEKASNVVDKIKTTFSWDNIKNTITTMTTNIKNKFNDIKNFKFNDFKISVSAKVDNFKKKVKDLLSNDSVLGDLFSWTKSKISSAKTWINSLDVGTGYVPYDQLAYIHKGEAVIPKKFNDREYFGGTNDETNALLETLIDRVDNLELSPYVAVKDIGEASLNYINNKSRIIGRSVI